MGTINPLDEIGLLEGTDKSSIEHDYLRHYDREFRHLKGAPVTLMEIGILGGSSLRMWRTYFPTGKIVGVDIDPHCRKYAQGGVQVEIGSQEDPEFLHAIYEKHKPDIIIDDGSHRADHIVYTFEQLFPRLPENGCYVIEDLHFHAPPMVHDWKGPSDFSAAGYFSDVMNSLAQDHVPPEDYSGIRRYLFDRIDRISVIRRTLIIWKNAGRHMSDAAFQAMQDAMQPSQSGESWDRLAILLLRRGQFDKAEAAARRAILHAEHAPWHHFRLAQILQNQGNIAGALLAAKEAQSRANHTVFTDFIAAIEGRQA